VSRFYELCAYMHSRLGECPAAYLVIFVKMCKIITFLRSRCIFSSTCGEQGKGAER